jgi:hypothetical protein
MRYMPSNHELTDQQLIELCESSTKVSGQYGGFGCPMDRSSIVRITNVCGHPPVGFIFRKLPALPICASQLQLLLGTLLGDGCLSIPENETKKPYVPRPPSLTKRGVVRKSRTPTTPPRGPCIRYRANHSVKQDLYCRDKAAKLGWLVLSTPHVSKNGGFGTFNTAFSTLKSPSLDFLRTLCYRQDETGRYVKEVNEHWLSLLDWEGVAYWVMDDGTSGGALSIATHGFRHEETVLLANWLTAKGIDALVSIERKPDGRQYSYVRLNRESSRLLAERIRPFMHPSMMYKLDAIAPQMPVITCSCCGVEMPARSNQLVARHPICGSDACTLWAKQQSVLIVDSSLSDEEKQKRTEKRNLQSKLHWANNLEACRASARNASRLKRLLHGDEVRESRREYRRRMKGDPIYEEKLKQERAAYYARISSDPERRAKRQARALAWKRAHGQQPRTKLSPEEAAARRREAKKRFKLKMRSLSQSASSPSPILEKTTSTT